MMRQVKIIIYIVVLLSGGLLFFSGFYHDQSKLALIDNDNDSSINIGVNSFEIDPIYDRVVIFIIDSLRVDFLNIEKRNPNKFSHNNMENINSLMLSSKLKNHVKFYNFKSDFPTLTTFRVRALMTGENPGFLDLYSSVNPGKAKTDSNILFSLKMRNYTSTVIGDETWSHTFGEYITNDYKYSSFNMFDFDSLDNFVYSKSKMYLDLKGKLYTKYNDWKLLVMHFIGVDHIGHATGTCNSAATAKKLSELDNFAKYVILKLLRVNKSEYEINNLDKFEFSRIVENYTIQKHSDSEKILFLLFGDHGQNDNGSHGGPSVMETSSGLFAFSTIPFKKSMTQHEEWYGPVINSSDSIPFEKRIEKIEVINQVDIVPVLSSSLGVPIPENNLGVYNSDFFVEYLKIGNHHDQKNDNLGTNSSGNELKELILYAKIVHNNSIQLYKKYVKKKRKGFEKDQINRIFLEFKESYDRFSAVDNNKYSNDEPIYICKKHLSLSYKLSELSRNAIFKDRSEFDWVKITQGLLITTSLLVFVLISMIPKIDPFTQSKTIMNNKPLILGFLASIFSSSSFNVIGTVLFGEIFSSYSPILNATTCLMAMCFILFLLIRFNMEINVFCRKIYYMITSSGIESKWISLWLFMCFLCLVQLCSYSAGFMKNEDSVVRFLLSSYQVISLFSGMKNNLKGMVIPIIQLFLVRLTYYLSLNFGQNPLQLSYIANLFTIFSLISYLYLILLFYRKVLDRFNLFLLLLSPFYVWFKWINNIYITRIIGIIVIFHIFKTIVGRHFNDAVKKEFNNDNKLNNRWISNNLIVIFMLKSNVVAQFSISGIIQLIEFKKINARKEGSKFLTSKALENFVLLYLTSINNLFNLGVRLDLNSIPGHVGFIGTKEFNLVLSSILVCYFVTSHLNTLVSQVGVKSVWNGHVNKSFARTFILSILLSRLLFTMLGIIILRSNIMVWQLLSPKLIYEFLFNISFSLYSLCV